MSDRITTDDMRQFLLSILPGVNGAPDGDDRDEQIDLRAMAAAMACEHLPASVLNDKAIGDALRSFHEWPSAAAVWHFLSVRHRAAPPSPPVPRVVRSEMPPWRSPRLPPEHAPPASPPRSLQAPQPLCERVKS